MTFQFVYLLQRIAKRVMVVVLCTCQSSVTCSMTEHDPQTVAEQEDWHHEDSS
jgi:hypothetical protein